MTVYCPECSTPATDDVRYCKKCGTSLRGADAIQSRETGGFDWSKTWVAEMLLSEDERARRRAAMEVPSRPEDLAAAELKLVSDLQGEIKAGIITASAGIGVTIFLLIFMRTIAAMQSEPEVATMLNSIWAAGFIPFFVGLGILANALFVSKHFSRHRRNILRSVFAAGEPARVTGEIPALAPPPSVVPSVTEHTTHHLAEPERVPRERSMRE